MSYHSHSDRPILPAMVDSEAVLNQASDGGNCLYYTLVNLLREQGE